MGHSTSVCFFWYLVNFVQKIWLDRLFKSCKHLKKTKEFEGEDFFNYNRFINRGLPEKFKYMQNFYVVMNQNTARVFDLIETMKRLSGFLWPDDWIITIDYICKLSFQCSKILIFVKRGKFYFIFLIPIINKSKQKKN